MQAYRGLCGPAFTGDLENVNLNICEEARNMAELLYNKEF